MAKQIAEASKSPRMGRSGGRHSRCHSAPSCSSSRRRPKARTSVNLCWPRPATAATPPGSCQRGRWSPGAGPRPAVELQPIAVTPEPGSSSLAVPSSWLNLSICPQRSPTDNSVRDRPVELHHQPSVGDPRLLPKPAVPSRLVAPGPPPPAPPPTTRARRRSGQSRRRLIARVGVTDSVGQGVPSACPRRGTRHRPMPHSTPTRVRRASRQRILLSTKASCQWWRGRP
jgi:hypothetical protein